ncbi:uncharacterized protein LOC133725574 isoform X2 [Rosa rugosa]|uniref:uncharacterized protein LOC133725574 isoform X2 n=1 Tax=Rosa rugosa TaxID=74645 RepID=UPI002B40E035|nr:uncharacterized protein LOC133725574 isoform X2 [Rosa rugosa]
MASRVLVGIRKLLVGRSCYKASIPTSQFSTLAVDGLSSSVVPLQPISGHSGVLTFDKIRGNIRDTSLQAVCCFYGTNDFSFKYIQRLVDKFPPVKAFHFVLDDNDKPMYHFYQNGEKVEELAGDYIKRFKTVLEKLYNPQEVGTKAKENVMHEGVVRRRNEEERKKPMMSIYMNQLFPRSNSSFKLSSGNALEAEVVRLREDKFLVDAGLGTPRICMQDETTGVPNRAIRFKTKVGYISKGGVAGESVIKEQMLERFFIDVVAGESKIKERAAARFQSLVGSTDVVAGEPHLLLPRRFRQRRAWMELNKIWQRNRKVKGFILQKVKGGYLVGIGGFVTFLPIRRKIAISNGRFTIESINRKRPNIVVF